MDKTEITIATYNQYAGKYEDKFMDFELYKKQLLSFYQLLKPGIKVLDLGCGPGNSAKLLTEKVPSVNILGIDLSEKMVSIASKNVPTAKFIVGDIRDIKSIGGSFDVVIASFCLPHLNYMEAEKLLNDIGGLLISSGLLYLSFMEGKNSGFETTSFSPDKMIYFNYFSEECVEKMLIKNGFKINKINKVNYPEIDGTYTVDIFMIAQKDVRDDSALGAD